MSGSEMERERETDWERGGEGERARRRGEEEKRGRQGERAIRA